MLPTDPWTSDSLVHAVAALGAAVLAYGVASLLQAVAARRAEGRGTAALLLSPLVLGGLALDVVGFVACAVALTQLPLFFVQGASSASILVTALLASLVLGVRPDRQEAIAMPLVLAGLVGLALAAEPGVASALPASLLVGLAVSVPAVTVGAALCLSRPGRSSALGLALLAGLSYGGASLAARGLSAPDSPSHWQAVTIALIAVHALQGVVLVTVAMRSASVNSVTSVLFATEAVGPATVGLLLLGDRTAPGTGGFAVFGCLCIVTATAVLARRRPAGPEQAQPAQSGQAAQAGQPGQSGQSGQPGQPGQADAAARQDVLPPFVPLPRHPRDSTPARRGSGAHRVGRHRASSGLFARSPD